MSILFKPNGTLNVSTDPCDLAEEVDGYNIISYEMQRCKNLRIDQKGVAQTRDGMSKINSTALAQTKIWRIIEQGGVRYTFAGTVIYKDETSIATGLTSAAWSGILYNPYNVTTQSLFALNGTDRKKIEGSTAYEWGITAPTAAPTISTGSLAGLTGTYNAKITYCRKSGSTVICESNPSPAASAGVALEDESLNIVWVASSDAQVTHVRVYRTGADGATYYHDQDIAIGTLSVDSNTADGSLGTTVATNHDRPPLGSFVAGPNYDGTCFIIKDNLLYFCLAKQPEYFPVANYIEVGPPQYPGKCLVFYGGQPYYLNTHAIYYIQGSGTDTFFPVEMDASTGSQSADGAVSVQGHGIYHTGSDGIYLWSILEDKKITGEAFEKIFRGENANGVPGVGSMSTSWLKHFQNKIYFGYSDNVLVLDLTTNRVTYYDWGTSFRNLSIDEENKRLIAGNNAGFLWHLENRKVPNDAGTAISWEIESKDFTLQTRPHFPRNVRYDIDASASNCSATGELILDGVSHQSHTLTKNRDTTKRLVDTGNGSRCSLKASGTGTVKIYAIESE